jgi:hypothetical protein
VAVDDRGGDVDKLVAAVLGMFTEHPEGLIRIDRVAGHQDPLRLLDHRPPAESSLQVVVLAEPLERNVDRALQFLGSRIDEVRENAAFGRLADVSRVFGGEERDHRAAGFADDLFDQLERVLRRHTKSDERDIRLLPCSHRGDRRDVDLAGDHLMPEPGYNLSEQLKPVAPFVGNQDPQPLNLVLNHPASSPREDFYPDGRHRITRWKPLQDAFCPGSRAAQSRWLGPSNNRLCAVTRESPFGVTG